MGLRVTYLSQRDRAFLYKMLLLAFFLLQEGNSAYLLTRQSSIRQRLRQRELVFIRYAASPSPFDPDVQRTLYDILGAKPDDSTQTLRKKYVQLARASHPDAIRRNLDGNTTDVIVNNELDFTEIAEAWSVLSDERERRRYDRELQAKQWADSFEVFLDKGINAAIPFVRKTAITTNKVAKNSRRQLDDFSEKFNQEMNRQQFGNQIRALEQEASREMKKAEKIQKQIETLPQTRRIRKLEEDSRNYGSFLTSGEAIKILQDFQKQEKTYSVTVETLAAAAADINARDDRLFWDIERLGVMEADVKRSTSNRDAQEREVVSVERAVDQAKTAEVMALKRVQDLELQLAQAKEALNDARRNTVSKQQDRATAQNQLESSGKDLNKMLVTLEATQERLRYELRQRQDATLQKQATYLEQEKRMFEQNAMQLKQQIMKLEEQRKQETAQRQKETRQPTPIEQPPQQQVYEQSQSQPRSQQQRHQQQRGFDIDSNVGNPDSNMQNRG